MRSSCEDNREPRERLAGRRQSRPMSARLACWFLFLVACGDDAASLPDAGAVDAAPDAPSYCADPPSDPLAPGMHKVYLATEGVTLDTGCDSARDNCTNIIPSNDTVIPAFLPG